MSDKYTYEEIGNLFCRRNIKIGTALSFDDTGSLHKSIEGALNSGAKHIEITSLSRQGAARSFDLPSSATSEVKRLAQFNSVTFSVHASPYLKMSGFGNNGFSLEIRNQAIREAKASIDFAYAITHIKNESFLVLHPNSFPRPVSNIGGEFREGNLINYYLVDPRTEQIVAVISEQDLVFIPQQAKDTRGNPLWLLDRNRQPLLDSLAGKPIPRLATDINGRIRGEQVRFSEYIQREKREGKSLNEIIKNFLHFQRSSEVNRGYLGLIEAERTLSDAQTRRDRLQDALEHYRNVNGVLSQDERWRIEKIIPDRLNSLGISVPSDVRSVVSLLEDELQANQRIIETARQNLTGGWPQLTQLLESLREIKLLEEHGLDKISEVIAELGEYSFCKSSDNPVRLAIENLASPQMYGSCASELLEIIEESRKNLALRLQKRGYGGSESKRLARELIGATLDIGHLNLCRQFYTGDAFHHWMISQTRELSKGNDIFNVHLSDNRGNDDSHLSLGEGNVPIQAMLTVLAEDDYKGFVVVEGVGSPETTRHSMNLFGVVPRATDNELLGHFTPRQAFYGLFPKDDPDRPWFGKEE